MRAVAAIGLLNKVWDALRLDKAAMTTDLEARIKDRLGLEMV